MMNLRLDTSALRALIKDNPTFSLEIQKNVMDNIKKDQLDEAVKTRLNQALNSMMEKSGSYYSPTYHIKPGSKLHDAMVSTVAGVVEELAIEKVQSLTARLIEQERAKIRNELQAFAKEAMMLAVTPEMAKEILLKKLI